LQYKIIDFQESWKDKRLEFTNMKKFFLNFAVIKPIRANKRPTDITLSDYDVTEQSFLSKFEEVLGQNSLVLGKLIYVLASGHLDNISFNFLEFCKLFTNLIVSKPQVSQHLL
jgi:hypothetical protein